jgi:outer membrane protein assembly factor BamE (lipoprotein component of BamABCDE complex)
MKRSQRIIAVAGLCLLLAGCAPVYRNHGYAPPDDLLAGIEVGRDTQAEVANAVGRPTAEGVLGKDAWYFVQSRFRHFGYLPPREIDRDVVAITFDSGGTVSNIERFGLEQGRSVPISREVTDSNVRDVGFLRQLFGNIGNFNPAGVFED